MSQRHGPVAKTTLAALLLLLGGCEAIYDDTKGWANRLEASILESAHEMSAEPASEQDSNDGSERITESDASQTDAKAPMATPPAPPIRKPVMTVADVPPQARATTAALEQTASKPSGTVNDTAESLIEATEQPKSDKVDKTGKKEEVAAIKPPRPKPEVSKPAQEGSDVTQKQASATPEQMQHKSDTAMVLHLSSLRSEKAAKREWSDLQRAHPDRLGEMHAEFRKTELGGKGTFYRVLAGPLKSPTAAQEACAALKTKDQKQYCRVMPAKSKS